MNELIAGSGSGKVPAVLAAMRTEDKTRFAEFFAGQIRNRNTRRAYLRATLDFCAFIDARGIDGLRAIEPLHVAAWVETLTRGHAAPTVKVRLAAIRHLFDWMVTGQALPFNPAHAVRGPKHSVKRGKTVVLAADEARQLLDAIDVLTLRGQRDRALIGLMVYSFARIGAAISMTVADVFHERRRLWVRLHEKGGKEHVMPCHHNLETYLADYLDRAGLRDTPVSPLFQSMPRRSEALTGRPLAQSDAFQIIRRRAEAAGITAKIGNHSFRATGITAYLKNGGTLESAAAMANHASMRTTQLYDRRPDDVTLDEVERIVI